MCFFAIGALGVLFGGVVLGYLFDLFSSDRLDVGDMATWVAALSTFFAAIGTIGTLILLNKQHKQNVEHQENIWKKQEAAIDFARYRDHKKQFEELLDSLEAKHTNLYLFRDRNKLYSDLFPSNTPRNNLSDYQFKLDNHKLIESHPLKSAWKNIDKIDRILRTQGSGQLKQNLLGEQVFEEYPNPLPIHQIEHTIFAIASSLNLRSNRTPKSGDILNDGEVFTNIFEPMIMKNCLVHIYESLNEFCGLESPRKRGTIHSPHKIGWLLLHYYKSGDIPFYNEVVLGHYEIVNILFMLENLASLFPSGHDFKGFVSKLFDIMSKDGLIRNINNEESVRQYLVSIASKLNSMIKDEQAINLKKQIKAILNTIEKKLKIK